MRMRVVALMMFAAFFSTACVSMRPVWQSVPAYPSAGQSVIQMARDQAECEAWARQQTGYDPAMDALKGGAIGAAVGALGGAAAGAAIGAVTGNPGKGAAIGAAAGGIGGAGIGGGFGYTKSREGYERAYAACISARGYSVGAMPAAQPVQAPVMVPAPVVSPPVCVGTYFEEHGWQPDPYGGPPRYVRTGRMLCNGQPFP